VLKIDDGLFGEGSKKGIKGKKVLGGPNELIE
jgi:hypothetical protein